MQPPETVSSKGERSRKDIRDAAYNLFIEQGYAATSMRQIASEAGIALGGIYNHYASKDAIFEAIVLEHHPYHNVLDAIEKISAQSFEEYVSAAAQSLVQCFQENPNFLNLLLIEFVEFNGKHAPLLLETIYPQVTGLIRNLKGFEEQTRHISPPTLVRAFFSFFFSYYFTQRILSNVAVPGMPNDVLDQYVSIFLHGILPPPDSTRSDL